MSKFAIAKENTFRAKLFTFFLKIFVRPLVRLVWIKRITGKNNLPHRGPFIIAANHQSYFDFITLYSVLPFSPTFLAAEKFYSSKFWRPIMEYTGQIKVERTANNKSAVLNKGLRVLKNNKVLGIFPQGTRSRTGLIEKTYTGVAKFALKAKVPVIPIGIKGAFQIMPPQAKRPKLKKIIEINIGEPMDFSEYYNKAETNELYRQITNKIMRRIAFLSDKEYSEENI